MIMVKPLCFSIQKHCFRCIPFILLTSLFEKCYEILYIILDHFISVVLWLSFCSFTKYIHVYSRKNAYHIWCFVLMDKNTKLTIMNYLKCFVKLFEIFLSKYFFIICLHYFLYITHFFMSHVTAGCIII